MYDHDSFFTLSLSGRAGLAGVSVALAALWIPATIRMARGRTLALRLAIALLAFWLFEWLSPQIYYLYYMALLGVPAQIVIGPPPPPVETAALLWFGGPSTLSAHARGLLGLGLLAAALLAPRSRPG